MSIVTVAKLAGVSHATVSRVINGREGVAEDTIRAVQQAMQSVGYTVSDRRPGPKPNSRRAKSKARIVCVCNEFPGKDDRPAGFELFVRGVEAALVQRDLGLNLVFTKDADTIPPAIRNEEPDGLLLHGVPPTGDAEALYRSLPVVWLMANRIEPRWGDQVMPNSDAIGQLAAEYLLARKHRHLALVNTRPGWYHRIRSKAFETAAIGAGAKATLLCESINQQIGNGNPSESMLLVLDRYLALSPRPTGLFIADEPQALWFHSLLQRSGVIPGKDVELVTCNNELKGYLSSLDPRPASMDIRLELIGRIAVECLFWRIDHRDVPGRIITQVDPLLVRGSET